eukprot:1693353-Amphidinium_carterae.1
MTSFQCLAALISEHKCHIGGIRVRFATATASLSSVCMKQKHTLTTLTDPILTYTLTLIDPRTHMGQAGYLPAPFGHGLTLTGLRILTVILNSQGSGELVAGVTLVV